MIVMRRVIDIFVIVAVIFDVDMLMYMHCVVVSVRVRMDDQIIIARRTSRAFELSLLVRDWRLH